MFVSALKKYSIYFLFLILGSCAARQDFPRFSDQPEAETTQLTPSTVQETTEALTGEAEKLRRQMRQRSASGDQVKDQAQSLMEETEQTLRHIEQGKIE